MAYIPYVGHDEARGLLAELYQRHADPRGHLDNILRIHSLNPRSLRDHVELYAHLMRGPSPLSRIQREMIAVTVSAENACFYWIVHHGAGLRTLTGDPALAAALARDYRSARLTPPDRAMLDYAVKLTRAPAEVSAADVDGLRDLGLTDAAILDVCQVVAYYNYVNRLADGLGVELEPFWSEDDLVLSRTEFEARGAGRAAPRVEVRGDPGASGG